MGTFVLGILVGWLAEWLFYTFWVNKGNGKKTGCGSLRSVLENKKREISGLKSKLGNTDVSSSNASKTVSSKAGVMKSSSSKVASKAATTSTKAMPVKKAASASAAASGTGNKSTSKKKASPAKKAAAKKSMTAKSTDNKIVTKKKAKAAGDDFTKLSGIGPSMAATLKTLGIDTYKKLAATDDDILRDMLKATGARMNNNKEAMDSWNEQATLAANGDFAGLEKMQEAIKK